MGLGVGEFVANHVRLFLHRFTSVCVEVSLVVVVLINHKHLLVLLIVAVV